MAASARPPVHPEALARFLTIYATALEWAVTTYPKEYGYPVTEVPLVVAKMARAFADGTFNKDGRAIKATCEALGIPYTYTAINRFLGARP